ncbi:MAG: hypothetical protein KJ018_14080 [Burkholderiales bacterium]|nr:hypothetical protein [Burkholderiales bacterium]
MPADPSSCTAEALWGPLLAHYSRVARGCACRGDADAVRLLAALAVCAGAPLLRCTAAGLAVELRRGSAARAQRTAELAAAAAGL